MICSQQALEEKLFELGFRDMGYSLSPQPLNRVLAGFVGNFIEPNCPVTPTLAHAFERMIGLFQLDPVLHSQALVALKDICGDLIKSRPKARITEENCPIGYYLHRAHDTDGFPLLGMSGRDLILCCGGEVIPALLIACKALPSTLRPGELRPEDLLGVITVYLRNPDNRTLMPSTCYKYQPHINKLLSYTAEVYRILGCGHPDLYAAEQEFDLQGEERLGANIYRQEKMPPSIMLPSVLKPNQLKDLLLNDRFDCSSEEAYNLSVSRLLKSMIFHYGSKRGNLIRRVSVGNYDCDRNIITFHVRPDMLLREETITMPLHSPITSWFEDMLSCRGIINPGDPLFCVYRNGRFIRISDKEAPSKAEERALYRSHLCYYQRMGGLNPVIDDRLSDRKESQSYIPRLYTRTSLSQLRTLHFRSFEKVSNFLGMNYVPSIHDDPEGDIVFSGGKRTPDKKVIKAIFGYFRDQGVTTFALSLRWLVFLLNFLCGCRAFEIYDLSITGIDLVLGEIKFIVKDISRRKNTTKVLPIHPFMADQLKAFLSLRREVLCALNCPEFQYLFFKGNGPDKLDEKDINGYYREVIEKAGTHSFTSHWLRYAAQTYLTEAGLEFRYVNCVLSHYALVDPIFSPYATIDFKDFRNKYLAAIDAMLREFI